MAEYLKVAWSVVLSAFVNATVSGVMAFDAMPSNLTLIGSAAKFTLLRIKVPSTLTSVTVADVTGFFSS